MRAFRVFGRLGQLAATAAVALPVGLAVAAATCRRADRESPEETFRRAAVGHRGEHAEGCNVCESIRDWQAKNPDRVPGDIWEAYELGLDVTETEGPVED